MTLIQDEPVKCWRKWSKRLFIRNDLRLLDARLEQLQHAPFFHEGLHGYVASMREVIAQLQTRIGELAPELTRELTMQIWAASRYLSGSVSREIPYEVVYGLDLALADWVSAPPSYIVTTAFLAEQNYHFEGVPEQFYALASTALGVTFTHRVVQVALPQLYKHQPLNNAVLYHELGHFVDTQFAISKLMAIMDTVHGESISDSKLSHAAEYFADLFASCYVGDAVAVMIENMAPNVGASFTHPATASRSVVVRDFLAGKQNGVVDLCNSALAALGLPLLVRRFAKPDVASYFDNIRPYHVASKAEVHGLLLAGQQYLVARLGNLTGLWANVSEGDAIRMINDLIEKSLRNWMIREKWRDDGAA